MVLLMEKIIPVLLLTISSPHIVKSHPGPIMIDDIAEQVVNEGETLKLTCAGDKEIFFHYPNSEMPHSLTTRIAVNMENNTILTTLNRKNVTVGDIGYFGCSYNSSTILQNDFNRQEDVSWKYIYVQSHKELFVPVKNFSLFVMEFQKGVIPCRPTSPNHTVTLYTENSDLNYTKVELSERIRFDPRIGFEIINASTPGAKKYKCEIILPDNKFSQQLDFQLILITEPYIIMETESKYLRRGRNFTLHCSYSNLWSHFNEVRWETPYGHFDCNSSERRITTSVSISTTDSGNITTCNLSVKKIKIYKSGIYTCVLRSPVFGIRRKATPIYVSNPAKVELKTSPKYAVKGDDFNITCMSKFLLPRISMDSSIYKERFFIPETKLFGRCTFQSSTSKNVLNSSIHDTYKIAKDSWNVIHRVINVFSMKNIDFNDEANYTCSCQSDDIEISRHKYIKVYDPKDVYVKLIPENAFLAEGFLTMSKIYGCYGQTIKFIAGIDTPSNLWNEIKVQWLNDTCNTLGPFSMKYKVITKGNSTELTIPDVQQSKMSGFCLRVTNGFRTAYHYFVMHVDNCI